MKLLLDTHIWLWLLEQPGQIAVPALRQLEEAGELILSAASVWELAIKTNLGKLHASGGAEELRNEILREIGARELPIFAEHALLAARLPTLQKDPFDRMLIAQAQVEHLTLVTADEQVRAYGGDLVWARA